MNTRLKIRLGVAYDGFDLKLDLDLPGRGVTTLFGPSGSGKSTLLRCLAGLERSRTGFIKLADSVWQDEGAGIFLPTHQRPLGYVFQEPRLFNHLTVRGNLEFGFKRTPANERRLGWNQIIELLALSHLLDRKPQHLSLGEQQRVAIGRALLASPKLLLMDEPLASLDIARKREVLVFIRKLHDELDIPVVYVSHSLQEVLQITDTLVLLRDGRVIASGPITALCSELSSYLADMAGSILETTVLAHEPEFALSRLAFSGGQLYVPIQDCDVGHALRVHVLARNVSIALEKPPISTSILNIIEAKIIAISEPEAGQHSVQIKLDVGVPLLANISRKSLHTLALEPGQKVYALVKAVALAQGLVAV